MSVNERIKLIREHLRENQVEFSNTLKINQKDVSRLETGIAKFIPNRVIKIFYDEIKVNLNWLFSGKGNMFLDKQNNVESSGFIDVRKLKEMEKEIDYLKQLLESKDELIDLMKKNR